MKAVNSGNFRFLWGGFPFVGPVRRDDEDLEVEGSGILKGALNVRLKIINSLINNTNNQNQDLLDLSSGFKYDPLPTPPPRDFTSGYAIFGVVIGGASLVFVGILGYKAYSSYSGYHGVCFRQIAKTLSGICHSGRKNDHDLELANPEEAETLV